MINHNRRLIWAVVLLGAAIFIAATVAASYSEGQAKERPTAAQGGTFPLYLPAVYDDSAPLLCRFGVNVIVPMSSINYQALRSGWYANYVAVESPERPYGTEFVQTIRFKQVGANDYQANRTPEQIGDIAIANPGSAWLIGNEPDRKDFQDDLEPHVYAKAYHDTYEIIKAADPTARVIAGTIVQPTPLRLEYLDLVLASYQSNYSTALPTDGWSIHNFILNEVSCDYDDTNCWGAEIPPGVTANFGEILTLEDNKNVTLFKERIIRFRQWMNDNGYQGLPVLLSEYGILMPQDFPGFEAAAVNQFMNETFDYMLSVTDPVLGNPDDEYRLIQQFAWYSSGAPGDPYNGFLFDNNTQVISPMGLNYAAYTSQIPSDVDLFPSRMISQTLSGSTVQISTTIANGGNLTKPTNLSTVRFYDGDPNGGGQQIGSDQSIALSGCGQTETISVNWNNPPAGANTVYVVVDTADVVSESDELNNVYTIAVFGE